MGRCWVDVGRCGLPHSSTAVHQKCHTSKRPPDVILRRSFTRPSTTLAVIEGLGTRLILTISMFTSLIPRLGGHGMGMSLHYLLTLEYPLLAACSCVVAMSRRGRSLFLSGEEQMRDPSAFIPSLLTWWSPETTPGRRQRREKADSQAIEYQSRRVYFHK